VGDAGAARSQPSEQDRNAELNVGDIEAIIAAARR
jgi:hypothetical protein